MIKTLKKQVINLLKELRKEGISKTSISENTKISRPTLDKMFKGQIDNLTLDTIEKLFAAYEKYLPDMVIDVKDKKSIETLLVSNAKLMESLEIVTRELVRKNEEIDRLNKVKN